RALRKDDHLVSESRELLETEQWTFPELRHVRQQRRLYFLGERLEFIRVLQRLGKNGIGASIEITSCAFHGRIEIFHRSRIRPRNNHEIVIATSIYSGFNFCSHLIHVDNGFAGEMPAAFGELLIFDVTSSQSRFLQLANSACYIFPAAKTSVRVDDRRNTD